MATDVEVIGVFTGTFVTQILVAVNSFVFQGFYCLYKIEMIWIKVYEAFLNIEKNNVVSVIFKSNSDMISDKR